MAAFTPLTLADLPAMSARMDEQGRCIWAAPMRFCSCGGELLAASHDVCSDCWLADYRRRYRGAIGLQSLWRGYKTRKDVAERNAEEVAAVTDLWRTYDEQYKAYAICQTIEAELKKDDPTWDATKTPYYVWMLEHSRFIDECETYMRRRGWVRPKKTRFRYPSVFLKMVKSVLVSCDMPAAKQRLFLEQMQALLRNH